MRANKDLNINFNLNLYMSTEENYLNHKFAIYLIYALVLLALFPLIQFKYFNSTLEHETSNRFLFNIRLAFSGPILLVAGLILVLKYKNYFHKMVGVVSLIGGVYWAIKLFEAPASF